MDIYIYGTTALLGLFSGILIGFVTAIKTLGRFYNFESKDASEYTPLEKLKNALLTFALVDIKKEDMAGLDMNYAKYDGSKFPALSGSSLVNACYTYIFNRASFLKSPLFTEMYESKLDAIEKYLNLHLKSEDQTMDFFKKFCEKHVEK
jgi:hypothetical protein